MDPNPTCSYQKRRLEHTCAHTRGDHVKTGGEGSNLKSKERDFPAGTVVKNPPANEGTQVRSLVREDPTCCRATKPVSHTTEARAPRARAPQ